MKFLLAGILTLLICDPASSCDCDPLPEIRNAIHAYSLIFQGQVLDTLPGDGDAVAVFLVSRTYKGVRRDTVMIHYDAASSCLLSFAPGERWIIYSNPDKYRRHEVHFCGHSRKFISDSGAQDHYYASRLLTFVQEDSLLGSMLHPTTEEFNTQEFPERTLEHPERGRAIWYILAAIPAFALILYLLKKLL